MTMTGAVTKKEDGVVEVALRGANTLGDHVIGTVTLELPDPPITWSDGEAPRTTKRQRRRSSARRPRSDKKHKKKGKK